MVNSSLLTLSIGPVQSFIEQARRAEDLYAGSQILTRLMLAAHQALGSVEHTVIYPIRFETTGPESLTHKLLVVLPADAESIASHLEQEIRQTWADLATSAWETLSRYAAPDEAQWRRQLQQLPEIYWTLTPYDDSQYASAFPQAGRDFAARKMVRNFEQFAEVGPKCTVCGERAALHSAGDAGARDYWQAVANHPEVGEAKLRPEGRERLCAVCAVKRFASLEQTFPSVSEVAAAPFKQQLLAYMQAGTEDIETSLRSPLNNLRQQLKLLQIPRLRQPTIPALQPDQAAAIWREPAEIVGHYDGEWFYPETYGRMLTEAKTLSAAYIRQAEEAAVQLLQAVRKLKIAPHRPSPYYAILYADGDKMGQQLFDAAAKGKEHHIEISRILARFAAEFTRDKVEKHAGQLVYAGGDDVVALLPAVEALPAANALRQAYQQQMNRVLDNPTMSAGVAIVHHLTPLTLALQMARRAEKAAKKQFNRNAVAVAFHKRSGEDVLVGGHWQPSGSGEFDTVGLLDVFKQHIFDKKLSGGLGYDILAEADVLPEAAWEAELKRLLRRNIMVTEKTPVVNKLTPLLLQLTRSIEIRENGESQEKDGPNSRLSPLTMAARWLILMRFLAQEGETDG